MPNQNNAEENDVAYILVPILNSRLEEVARSASWPEDVIKALSVDYDGDSVYVNVAPDYQTKVDDLEMGTRSTVPNAVISPFIARSSDIVNEVLLSKTVDEMASLLSEVFLG